MQVATSGGKYPLNELLNEIRTSLTRGDTAGALSLVQKAVSVSGSTPQDIGDIIGRAAVYAYDDFSVQPVEEFFNTLPALLTEATLATFKSRLEPHVSLTHEWKKKLEDVFMERAGRELSNAVRAGSIETALRMCNYLFSMEKSRDGKMRMASILGNILGTVETRQDEVKNLIQKLRHIAPSWDVSEEAIAHVEKTSQERLALMYKTQVENRGVQWYRILTTTTAEMKRYLPLSTTIGEPGKEDIEKIRNLIRSLIRCYFLPPHAGFWEDIVSLLVEFCPREVSTASAAAGMESRLFNSLTPLQKRVIITVMTELGDNQFLIDEMIQFATDHKGERYQHFAIEILGGFKAEGAVDYFVGCLKDKSLVPLRSVVIAALGSLYHPRARIVLKELLRAVLSVKPIDPSRRQGATNILLALAKISRNKNLSPDERNGIIRDVIELLNRKDPRLNLICSENFFLTKPDEINGVFRSWAVQSLVEGFWLKDISPEFKKGSQAGPQSGHTILGQRENWLDQLVRFGSEFLPEVIETAERFMIHYSSAYIAIGELMAHIGDERAVPLLEKLLIATFTTDDAAFLKYEKEHYWDAITESRQVLNKDKIASTLIYALNKIGGTRADCVLADLYEKVQAGHFIIPGDETGEMLFKAHERLSAASKTEEKNVCTDVIPAGGVSEKELGKALKSLKRIYLFSSAKAKRFKKVAALQTLGQAKDPKPKTIQSIIAYLKDPDSLIAAAASAALVDYNTPPMQVNILSPFLHALFREWNTASPKLRKKIEDILRKLRPERDIMRKNIRTAIDGEKEPRVRFAMEKFFAPSILTPAVSVRLTPPPEEEGTSEGKKETPAPLMNKLDLLEQKRLFLEARRRWIAGGKKGEPPKPEDFTPKTKSP